MALRILTDDRVKEITNALNPWFVNKEQDALVAALDQAADEAQDAAFELTQPLYEFRSDIQSTAGAGMVGIFDSNDYFTGSTVEEALEELYLLTGGGGMGGIIDSIADGDTVNAPSRNAVFDALALKADTTAVNSALALKADLASPPFTGTPTAPTPLTADNSTTLATTAFVKAQGYTSNTGTVTSVNATGSTGLSVSGGPITGSGSLSLTLSTNLQSWSSVAPSAKADDSAVVHLAGTETVTGDKTFSGEVITNGGISMGASLAASVNDTSRHLQLHSSGSGYGISITSGKMNFTVGSGGGFDWYPNGSSTAALSISSGAVVSYGGIEIGYKNFINSSTSLVQGKMCVRTTGFTLNTTSAADETYMVYNDSAAAITITQGAGLTLRLAGTTTTGNRTLAARGIATIWYRTTSEAVMFGNVT